MIASPRDGLATGGRAVLITHVVPDPYGNGLARRAWSWVSELAERHELDTVVVSRNPSPTATPTLPGRVTCLRPVGAPVTSRRLTDFTQPDAAVAEAMAGMSGPIPARVVVFRLYNHDVAALLPAAWRDRAEVDCDDWESATRFSLARIAARRGRWRDARIRLGEALAYARLERQALRSYKAVHVAAREDVPKLRRLFGLQDVLARPNRIAALPGSAETDIEPGRKTLLFVGTLKYEPNDDAVRWIGEAIAPRLRRLVPEAEFLIAGKAKKDLQTFMSSCGLTYIPAPPELRPLYARSAIVVAPLRGGGGTKIKVLEGWQHHRPVVATSHAARGLAAVPGRHLIVADTATAFAAACADLLSRRDKARSIADAGYNLFRQAYQL